MKNPYKKGKVHPSPPASTLDHCLSLLPATILTLTTALSLEDKQVLAYLISCSGNLASTTYTNKWKATQKPVTRVDHSPAFGCDCFRCYMSFWVRWDASPNRQVIDEIIEAYEVELLARDKKQNKKKVVKKKRDGGKNVCDDFGEERRLEEEMKQEGFMGKEELNELGDSSCTFGQSENVQAGILDNNGTVVRKIVSFIGDQIWGFWSRD